MLVLYGACVSAACFWLAGRRRRDVAELEGRLSDSDAARIEAERRLHEAGVSAAVSRAQSDGAQVRLREVSEELAKTQHEFWPHAVARARFSSAQTPRRRSAMPNFARASTPIFKFWQTKFLTRRARNLWTRARRGLIR